MKFKLLVVAMLFLFPACLIESVANGDQKHTYFIQVPLDMESITNMQKILEPIINDIIAKELGDIELDKNIPIFFFKKRQAITVYYANDMYENGVGALLSILDSLRFKVDLHNIVINPKIDFFGDLKDDRMAMIDLVAHIDDPNKALSILNEEVKKIAYEANKEYKLAHQTDLYDIQKSERYSFLAHISLGHLRVNYIKYLIKDDLKADEVIARIKQSILSEVSRALLGLSVEDRTLYFNKLSIYDLSKRIYIKEYMLNE